MKMLSKPCPRVVLFSAALIALAPGMLRAQSPPTSAAPALGDIVWQDTFGKAITGSPEPNPVNWAYETGGGGWGNGELETYCAYGSNKTPCNAKQPNAFIGRDGYLHVSARKDASGTITSARLISKHLQSFQYGRFEARVRIPAGEGVWPAFWMLGENIDSVPWPACGEFDIMENIGKEPARIHGSIHGTGFTGMKLGLPYSLPSGQPFSGAFHNYGMIWSPQRVAYYVDDPGKPYAVFTPADLPAGGKWPFDDGKDFILLNLATGGSWPGPPDAATKFPAEMLVEYVKVWRLAGDAAAPPAAASQSNAATPEGNAATPEAAK
jgi:beta-glucanase (GH16 family)